MDPRAVLEDKRAKLETALDRIAAPSAEPTTISFGKRVGEGTSLAVDRIVQVVAHEQLQRTLSDVERALTKIESGSYGSCDECGAPINPERLEALPWAVLCTPCAARR